MKKIKTNSYFVYICEKNNKKFIRRYKRKGIHGYPRTMDLKNISKILEQTKILYPKFYRNRINYIEEEFIEETKNIQNINKSDLMDNIIEYIFEMSKIKSIKTKWKNNTEYLKFQIRNLQKVLKKRKYPLSEKENQKLKEIEKQLDDNRSLSFIHGDIHTKNMIVNEKGLYLIDWELAAFGDIAYELARCFTLMDYTESDKQNFIDKLSKKIVFDKSKLENDIYTYQEFEKFRVEILKKSHK